MLWMVGVYLRRVVVSYVWTSMQSFDRGGNLIDGTLKAG